MTEEPQSYTVNFETVKNDPAVPAFLRLLARDIIETGYVSVGKFYESLVDFEIEHLIAEYEYLTEENGEEPDPDDDTGQNLVLLTLMLCQADGTLDLAEDLLYSKYVPLTGNFAIIESLYRSGLIDVIRDNYSYSDDSLVVAKKLN
jgi:hypothetical protein